MSNGGKLEMRFIVHDLIKAFPGKSNTGALGLSNAELIVINGTKILFDTGSHGVKPTLVKSLNRLKVQADEIDAIVLSHLHYDHSENVAMFPKAKLFLSKKEWEYAHETCDIYTPYENLTYLSSRDVEFITKDGQDIFDGMKVIFTPGHTPGHISLVLETDNGRWTLAADAVKNRGELTLGEADQFVSESDSKNSIEKVKSISDRVLPGHDCWLSVNGENITAEFDITMDITLAHGIQGGKNGLFRLIVNR